MGTTTSSNTSQPPKYIQPSSDKLIVQLRSRSIILHYGYKFSLNIGDVAMFPHGLSGLKLWQSNIVLARFVIMNNHLFKGKKVLQLGAGTGIGGITVSKWTQCESIAMSDSRQQVIKNMTKNCQRNLIKNIIIFRLNLSQYQLFTNKYDIILCSQILRPSPITLKQVYNLFKHFLNPNGQVCIVMSDNVQKIQQFSQIVQEGEFQFRYQKLVEEEYYASPLLNKVEGYKEFQRLEVEDYYVVRMRRKQSVKGHEGKPVLVKVLPKLPQKSVKQSQKQSSCQKQQQKQQHQGKSYNINDDRDKDIDIQKKQEQQSPIKQFHTQNIDQKQLIDNINKVGDIQQPKQDNQQPKQIKQQQRQQLQSQQQQLQQQQKEYVQQQNKQQSHQEQQKQQIQQLQQKQQQQKQQQQQAQYNEHKKQQQQQNTLVQQQQQQQQQKQNKVAHNTDQNRNENEFEIQHQHQHTQLSQQKQQNQQQQQTEQLNQHQHQEKQKEQQADDDDKIVNQQQENQQQQINNNINQDRAQQEQQKIQKQEQQQQQLQQQRQQQHVIENLQQNEQRAQ